MKKSKKFTIKRSSLLWILFWIAVIALLSIIKSNAATATFTPTTTNTRVPTYTPVPTPTFQGAGPAGVATAGRPIAVLPSIPQAWVADLPATIATLSASGATPVPYRAVVSSIPMFGDSLTYGVTNWDDSTLSSTLMKRLNVTCFNYGVIAQTSRNICVRMGVYDVPCTITGNILPGTAGASCAVSFAMADSPTSDFGPQKMACSIGGVYGTFITTSSRSGTFYRDIAGAPITATSFTFHSSGYYPTGSLVSLEMGYNDRTAPTSVYANIAAAANKITNDGGDFIVQGLFVSSAATIGTADYTAVTTINGYLASTYGPRYFDALAAIRTGANPDIPQDAIDYANGIIPGSLTSDGLHPNGTGNYVWGNKLADFILAAGLWRISNASILSHLTEFSDRSFFAGGYAGRKQLRDYNHANIGIGEECMLNAELGQISTAVGNSALRGAVNPIADTALGSLALGACSGNLLTGVGASALQNLSTGDGCSALGYSAGNDTSWAYNCTFLGMNTGTSGASIVHSTALGYDAKVTTHNTIMMGTASDTTVHPGPVSFSLQRLQAAPTPVASWDVANAEWVNTMDANVKATLTPLIGNNAASIIAQATFQANLAATLTPIPGQVAANTNAIATATALVYTSYVPYTGASAALNLGANGMNCGPVTATGISRVLGSAMTLTGINFAPTGWKPYAICFGSSIPTWVDQTGPIARTDSAGNFVFDSGSGGDLYFNYDFGLRKVDFCSGKLVLNGASSLLTTSCATSIASLGVSTSLNVSGASTLAGVTCTSMGTSANATIGSGYIYGNSGGTYLSLHSTNGTELHWGDQYVRCDSSKVSMAVSNTTRLAVYDSAVSLNNPITLNGDIARAVAMQRAVTSNLAGNNLTLQSGGATSGATDKDGGMLSLVPGISTGLGKTSVRIKRYLRALSTGTSDNASVDAIIVPSEVNLTDNVSVTLFSVAMGAGTGAAGNIEYSVVCTDGTDIQTHAGSAQYAACQKGATFVTSIADEGATAEADASSSGTLAESWSIATGTDVIYILANFNSSLTPTSMKMYYRLHNASARSVTQY